VSNGGEINRLCTRFPIDEVAFSSIAQTGSELVAKNGVADPNCAVCGGGPPTTTSTVSTTPRPRRHDLDPLPGEPPQRRQPTSTSHTTTARRPRPASAGHQYHQYDHEHDHPALCGNGVVKRQTCDGNNSDNDGCP
jgi:hypothetical protein